MSTTPTEKVEPPTESPEALESISVGRLTQLHPELWLDLNEVVSVKTSTQKVTYARLVELTTRSGKSHTISIGGTSGNRPVREGDAKLAAWLTARLGHLLADLDADEGTK